MADLSACTASSFPTPDLFGAVINSINVQSVLNYSFDIPQGRYASQPGFNVTDVNFCNVSIWYTHSGWDDDVNVQVWLPLHDQWNGKFQGTGGGGFNVGLNEYAMSGAVGQGYAVASTDGGHTTQVAQEWVLRSPGNLNYPLVDNFGSRVLYDMAILGKNITQSFYGEPATYSYFTGCSTGGRQAMVLAQRWPELYDGILAGAPGINYNELASSLQWGLHNMIWLGGYTDPCELLAITAAAIEACDQLDGVQDGIILDSSKCLFDGSSLVNKTVKCPTTDQDVLITREAVRVANLMWEGARADDGSFLWYGLNKDAPLTLANTTCASGKCQAVPFDIAVDYPSLFILKDPDHDWTTVTHEQYTQIFRRSMQEFDSMLGSKDPDLRRLRKEGSKVIMWHGLTDSLVPIGGSRRYYHQVEKIDAELTDYFRLFEAPGVEHCRGGVGPFPEGVLDALIDWVEKGDAPEVVPGRSLPNGEGLVLERNLCLYPQQSKYLGGDIEKASSYKCVMIET